jgi:hypothetical protein
VLTKSLLRSFIGAGAAAGLLAACGDDEVTGIEDHTPAEYEVLVDGEVAVAPFDFTIGQTVRVQLKFFNDAGEDLDAVEDSHFGGLTFEPSTLVTVTRVADHNYQFDVTGGTPGSGTVTVGYGHSDSADEHEFPAEEVTVAPGEGPPPQ